MHWQPPRPRKPRLKKIDSTIILGIRTTPENRDTIKMYALQNKVSIGEFLETAIDTVIHGGVTPQKKKPAEIKEQKEPKDPRDKAAGRTKKLDLWGNDGTEKALEKIAAAVGCTPSELLKTMLIEKFQELEEEGIKTGLTTT